MAGISPQDSSFCPLCQNILTFENRVGPLLICECGWSGRPKERKKKGLSFIRYFSQSLPVVIAGVVFFAGMIGYMKWDRLLLSRIYYQSQSIMGLNSTLEHKTMGRLCYQAQKWLCAVDSLAQAVANGDKDLNNQVALVTSLNWTGQYQRALNFLEKMNYSQLPKSYQMELAGQYATSLAAVGRTEESISYYYQALEARPDSRSLLMGMINSLSRLERWGEALSVLGFYIDVNPDSKSELAILAEDLQTSLEASGEPSYKLSRMAKFHYAPVMWQGMETPELFMVDPKAPYFTVSKEFLTKNKVSFKKLRKISVESRFGRKIKADYVLFKAIHFGPWKVKNVKAVVCENCALVVGRPFLRRFKQTKWQDHSIDFLALKN